MGLFRVTCSHCQVTGGHARLFRREYPSSMPVVLGGFLLAWIFEGSRKPGFRCRSCGLEFRSHTLQSRFLLVLWVWFLLAICMAVIGLAVQALVR